jgi:hypothetical protein
VKDKAAGNKIADGLKKNPDSMPVRALAGKRYSRC